MPKKQKTPVCDKVAGDSRYCPECKADWQGDPIPENIRQHYGETTHWSRLIGIEDPLIYDGISWWQCPDCEARWDRWTGEKT